jgi:hypothetical protein
LVDDYAGDAGVFLCGGVRVLRRGVVCGEDEGDDRELEGGGAGESEGL